ncbi:hypothetical protein VMCG_03251 [Cytospora schulzeri]|uniref:Uncharacterized protein n=1 Tax=Cytospora schulzeri TaxID=448051 RepID=A0A423WYD7_9PEZI|nr:hypothetical protein VMCG_03251 [Valsa malicola]
MSFSVYPESKNQYLDGRTSFTDSTPLQFQPGMLGHMSSSREAQMLRQSRNSSPLPETTLNCSAPRSSSFSSLHANGHGSTQYSKVAVFDGIELPGTPPEETNYTAAAGNSNDVIDGPELIEKQQEHQSSNTTTCNGLNGGNHHGHRQNSLSLSDTRLPPAGIEAVMAPFDYINSLPSKGVREHLIESLNVWIEASPQAITNVKSVVGDIHNLSLMLDDVQDNSPMRRARAATHCVFGTAQTVNSATYHIVDVISRARELHDAEALSIVMDEMKSLLIGQSQDLLWTHLVSVPTVEDYLRMVDGKTGGLFRMISRLLISQSTSSRKPASLNRLMILFGRFFQIRDDYANLVSHQYAKTKGFAEDLDEGKYSFVLVHALHNAEPVTRTLLQNLLMQRRATGSTSDCNKELIVGLLRHAGSLEFTAQALQSLRDDLDDEIQRVETAVGKPNHGVRKIISALRIDMT